MDAIVNMIAKVIIAVVENMGRNVPPTVNVPDVKTTRLKQPKI